jgi:hypothetical protein
MKQELGDLIQIMGARLSAAITPPGKAQLPVDKTNMPAAKPSIPCCGASDRSAAGDSI